MLMFRYGKQTDLGMDWSAVRRIAIIGCCGSGKSWLTTRLCRLLNLQAIHLDDHYWLSGWQRLDHRAWQSKVEQLTSHAEWIIDGTHIDTLLPRLARADCVINLDFFEPFLLPGVIAREWRRSRGENDTLPINTRLEKPRSFLSFPRLAFFAKVALFRWRIRPRLCRLLKSVKCEVITLKTRRDVNLWLKAMESCDHVNRD
jgi:hypothetical protein